MNATESTECFSSTSFFYTVSYFKSFRVCCEGCQLGSCWWSLIVDVAGRCCGGLLVVFDCARGWELGGVLQGVGWGVVLRRVLPWW